MSKSLGLCCHLLATNLETTLSLKMRLRLPYEILLIIVEYINFEDVVNLARTSKELRFLETEEQICKKVLIVSIGRPLDGIQPLSEPRKSYLSAMKPSGLRKPVMAMPQLCVELQSATRR
jgi:hypothetical protein